MCMCLSLYVLYAEFALGRAELCQERPTTKEKEPMDHEKELSVSACHLILDYKFKRANGGGVAAGQHTFIIPLPYTLSRLYVQY